MKTPAITGYRFRDIARMEWLKLRSLRSTWWTLAFTVAGAVTIAVLVGLNSKAADTDITNNILAGVAAGLLLTGVLGALTMTNEYSSGLIRTTLAAVPDRRRLLAAKAAVFGAVALGVGEVAAFVSYLAGVATLPGGIPAPGLDQPAVLRAVLLAGGGYCLIGLIGLGLGAVIRHSGATIAVLVGGVYIGAQFLAMVSTNLVGYVPVAIVANSLAVTRPLPRALGPWTGLAVLCLYAVAALGAGGWLLRRRDA
jgi:ABC-type transport system involved in multi-copper enzyme maturation permease subunit